MQFELAFVDDLAKLDAEIAAVVVGRLQPDAVERVRLASVRRASGRDDHIERLHLYSRGQSFRLISPLHPSITVCYG